MECKECNLHINSDPSCIWGSGNKKASIMVINSYATDTDEEQGEATMPRELINRLNSIGINPKEVYYTNLIKCRAPKGTKYKVTEGNRCKVHTLKEIEKVDPAYILLLGAQAVKALLNESITNVNGSVIDWEGRKCVPSFSPGIIFRDPGKTTYVDQSFNNFKHALSGKINKGPELNLKIVKNISGIDKAFSYLRKHKYYDLTYDIETTGLNRFEDNVNLFGFGNDKVQFILPLNAPHSPLEGRELAQSKLTRHLIKCLNEHSRELIAGNGKFDDLFLQYHYHNRPRITFDVVLASHCLNENTPNGVKENAIVECNAKPWDVDKNLKTGNYKTKEKYQEYLTYLGYDILYQFKLFKVFNHKLKQDEAINLLYRELYIPGIQAYEEVEINGVYVNTKQFKKVRKHLEKNLGEIKKKLDKYKKDINWNSSNAVRNYIYDYLGIKPIEYTASGQPSTSEATLKRLSEQHPSIQLILDYRGVKIQISHFIDGWINRMHEGRLYPKFKLHGTVTGRTSCNDPNLQQVPRDPVIRTLIAAPPGWSLIEGDFSQAELRIATIMSGDPTMRQIYQTGGDIHTHTYEMISGETISDDKYEKKEQRKKAKAVNFGFVYGMGWRKFKEYARDTYGVNLSDKEAEEYRIKFFDTYNHLPAWHKRQRKIVQALGQVRNPIGRLRRLPDIYSSDKGKKAEAERQSINSPVQGFGSDLTILGMSELALTSRVYNKKTREILIKNSDKYKIIGTVHDATLALVRNDFLYDFIPLMKKTLEAPLALEKVFKFDSPVPMVVDIAVGTSWGAGKELEFENDQWKEQVADYLEHLED